MQKWLLVLGAIILALIGWAAVIGIEPADRRPGTVLAGTVSELPPSWEIIDDVAEVHVETHPWWGIPLSVTVVIGRDGEQLYSPSIYAEPAEFPGTKFWNSIIQDNPEVRLRVGERIYNMRLEPVQDAQEFDRGFAALASKYPFWQKAVEDPSQRPPMAILRYTPR